MAIEIGNLVVRGSFGQPGRTENTVTEEQLRAVAERLRREMKDTLARQIRASEQRIREGRF